MYINVGFASHASVIECDGLENIEFSEISKAFENWLYEEIKDEQGSYFAVKKSLNVEILDVLVVIRFFNEVYPNSNARIINEKIDIEDADETYPGIYL